MPITASSAVPNLFVVDGSVLPTQGAANPALTIMALAARAADVLAAGARAGLAHRKATPMTALDRFDVDVYRVPTPAPESDGTLTWDATVAVTATVGAGRRARAGLDLQRTGRGRRDARSTHPGPATGATRTTSPAVTRRCVGPAATSAPAVWSCRPSARSTSRCGI